MIKFACIFAVIALASGSDVLDLDDSNFDDVIVEHDLALVEFFAPWCGHCKRLAPEFEKAGTALQGADPPIALIKVDCTVSTETCNKYDVSGYPTLKVFTAGTFAYEYEGEREADGIVKYMRSKSGPSSRELKSLADVEKFIDNFDHSIVGFFASEGSDIQKQFLKLADALNEDFRFAHTKDQAALEKFGYSDDVIIFQPKRLQNKFEEKAMKYDGEAVLQKLKSWVHDNIHGLAGHRTSGNNNQFKSPLVVVYYDVDYVKNAKGSNYWRNRVMKVATKLRDAGKNVNFAVSATSEFSQELSEYGVDSPGDKPMVAAKDVSNQKFVMTGEFSMDALEQFANDVLDGKLEAYMKSEPIPEDNTAPVKIAVAKNFNELVNDETKDVLIEFYAPWCGHCKTLAPKYDELAEKMADEEDILIVKMDATANDVPPQYQVSGFPTLFYAPKGSKTSPKKYEGGREVKDFIKYLAAESTEGLKGWSRDGKKKKSKTEL